MSVACREGEACGKEVASEDEAMQAGWSWLAVAGGWRCGDCVQILLQAGAIVGTGGQTEDKLDPTSRGALPKETASSITPPAVR